MIEPDQSAAEMRGLRRFAQGLGLDEETVREIHEAVEQEAAAAGVGDDNRIDEARKRMLPLLAVGGGVGPEKIA